MAAFGPLLGLMQIYDKPLSNPRGKTRWQGSASPNPATMAARQSTSMIEPQTTTPVADTLQGAASPVPVEASTPEEQEEQIYYKTLENLKAAKDLGLDNLAREAIDQQLAAGVRPPQICRMLIQRKMINRVQLGRAIVRSRRGREVMSFLDIPSEALDLRQSLDPRVISILRSERIIPLNLKLDEAHQPEELHLSSENPVRDLVLENQLKEALHPALKIIWHFCLREVAGAFWLSGQSEDIDTSMEAEALLDRIIGNAADARASDIHIDPSIKGEPRAIIKYRVDGFVHAKEVITTEQLERLKVRIENLARMPKVNFNHANKGAFTRSGYDWRVQIQPHAGRLGPVPRIVLRRLQPDVMPLEALGYPADYIAKIRKAAQAPNGVVFWTGPTGSGKTESIHAAVVSVNPMAKGLSVHTIEDPPEKRVAGYAVQMEVAEEDPARTALAMLKSSLRADPDVVIFGEVRDGNMAQLVFDAANTGHLVFTTLHTNSSIDAIVRLSELEIDGFLLSYIRGIAAQRLLRRLCAHCRQPAPEPDDYTRYIFDRYNVPLDGADLHVANIEGCASCNYTGYYGRIAAAEWLVPSKEIIEASQRKQWDLLEDMARRAGWQPMGRMAVEHVRRGTTDANEVSNKILELSAEKLG